MGPRSRFRRAAFSFLIVAAILWLLAFAGAVAAVDVSSGNFILTDEERADCRAQGGCMIVTRQWLAHEFARQRSAGTESCGKDS